ncbi:hypothetical protein YASMINEVIRUS_52 [Yasminevirus sp. GU-2018]|uniref:Uncharacterized protein n=1 Tax=Yasminevirus sp. GU-2018 TaxID=2420051 RepID=A0A5K0U6L6_9VIRU|nr:hypothetical protein YASMINEVIRUS_52 [Yasminevirus sp. GU-2018]
MKSKEVRELLGVSQKVLVGYQKRGIIRVVMCSDRTYDYNDDDVQYILENPKKKPSDQIVLIDPKTQSVFKTYDGADEAATDLEITRKGITHCLNHKTNTHYGYILKYEVDATPENIIVYSEQHNIAIDGTRRCFKCKDWYEIHEFRGDYCTSCERKRLFSLRSTVDGFFKTMYRTMILSSQCKIEKGRIDAGICKIDHMYLKQLHIEQEGRCYYSGLKLSTTPLSDWQASPERLNTDLGYIEDNVKLICLELNIGNSTWSKEKLKLAKELSMTSADMKHLRKSIRDINIVNKPKVSMKGIKQKIIEKDDIRLYECLYCGDFYPLGQISKNNIVQKQCKECKNKVNRDYKSSLRGFIVMSLDHAKRRTTHKFTKRGDDCKQFNLSIESICNRILEQKGKCYYSGIPLVFEQNHDWKCSFERLDSTKGYTIENTVLVCVEFNSIDRKPTAVNTGTGSSQWSKEKVEFMFNNMKD